MEELRIVDFRLGEILIENKVSAYFLNTKAIPLISSKVRFVPGSTRYFQAFELHLRSRFLVIFPNKNEWKRHVAYQHLQLGYYRCNLDTCNPDNIANTTENKSSQSKSSTRSHLSIHNTEKLTPPLSSKVKADEDEIIKIYNDFTRKDLFTQHFRRMHGPSRNPALRSTPPGGKKATLVPTKEDEAAFERQLDLIREECWRTRRKAPACSGCARGVGFLTKCLTRASTVIQAKGKEMHQP